MGEEWLMSIRGEEVCRRAPTGSQPSSRCIAPRPCPFLCAGKLSARVSELEAEVAERDARIADILSEGEALSRKQSTFEEKLKGLRGQLKAMQADRDARREEVVAGASPSAGTATAIPLLQGTPLLYQPRAPSAPAAEERLTRMAARVAEMEAEAQYARRDKDSASDFAAASQASRVGAHCCFCCRWPPTTMSPNLLDTSFLLSLPPLRRRSA